MRCKCFGKAAWKRTVFLSKRNCEIFRNRITSRHDYSSFKYGCHSSCTTNDYYFVHCTCLWALCWNNWGPSIWPWIEYNICVWGKGKLVAPCCKRGSWLLYTNRADPGDCRERNGVHIALAVFCIHTFNFQFLTLNFTSLTIHCTNKIHEIR